MVMTTHSYVAPKLKKKYSYTSTPPIGLHGLSYGRLYLYFTYLQYMLHNNNDNS